MVDKSRRAELLQQFSERPSQNGIFAIRNTKTGEVWVGHSRNIDKQQNSLWVRLSGPQSANKDVQASWKTHGADAFGYEILERLSESDPFALELLRTERAEHWRQQLSAGTVKGS